MLRLLQVLFLTLANFVALFGLFLIWSDLINYSIILDNLWYLLLIFASSLFFGTFVILFLDYLYRKNLRKSSQILLDQQEVPQNYFLSQEIENFKLKHNKVLSLLRKVRYHIQNIDNLQ